MSTKRLSERRCSYVVLIHDAAAAELRELSEYLSELNVAGCEVVILDPSPRMQFELNARTLRWVGRHVALAPEYRTRRGVDVVQAAAAYASCEKVIVAGSDIRYAPDAVEKMCARLESHEVVEPQDYLDPMPWWGGIEAGRILIHRGIEPEPDHGATFGFRRNALRALRALGPATSNDAQVRRLAAVGAEIHPAPDVFVRRQPGPLAAWIASRPRLAGEDFTMPVKTLFFFSLLPLLVLLSVLGGMQMAGGYASMIAFASVGLAARGRAGAGAFFPWRACLFAPLWVLERSISVYWALLRKMRGVEEDELGVAIPDRASGSKAASGE